MRDRIHSVPAVYRCCAVVEEWDEEASWLNTWDALYDDWDVGNVSLWSCGWDIIWFECGFVFLTFLTTSNKLL